MPSAIATGYRKGIATIIDANVITLITAFILFVLATRRGQGLRLHARRRHDRLAVHRGRLHPGLPRPLRPRAVHALAAAARRRARSGCAGTSTSRRQPLVLLDLGRDPAIGAIAFATKQLNLGIDFESGTRITASLAEPAERARRSARRSSTPASAAPTAPRSRSRGRRGRRVRRQRRPDPGRRSRPTRSARSRTALDERVRPRGRRRGLRLAERSARPSASRSRAAPMLRDHLLAAGDLRPTSRSGSRPSTRCPVLIAAGPRHPDHRRRLLAGGTGGDERHRRGLPDHPRLLALRHGDRLRPNPRERAADAARGLLPDRQPLDERGARPGR